jgi:ATP-dependent DNA ligase
MQFQPMPLSYRAEPFTHPEWVFEVKWDGFRSLAYVENGRCKLVSRKGNEFKSFPDLNVALLLECSAKRAVLDGEIVCLDKRGNSQFRDLLFLRGEPRFYAFDLLSLMAKTCVICRSRIESIGSKAWLQVRARGCFIAITSRSAGNIYSGLHASPI